MQRTQEWVGSFFTKKPTAEEIAERDRKATQALVSLGQQIILICSGASFLVYGTSTLTIAIAGLGAYSEIIANKYYEKKDPAKADYIASKYSAVSTFCNMFHTVVAKPVAVSFLEKLNEARNQHKA